MIRLKSAALITLMFFCSNWTSESSGQESPTQVEDLAEVDPFGGGGGDTPVPQAIYRRPTIESLRDFELGEYDYAASFTIIPTFHTPVHVRIFLKKDGGKLFVKRWSGAGGYDSGEVNLAFETHLNGASYFQFLIHLEECGFWNLPEKEEDAPGFLDGAGWRIEVRSKDRFTSVYRHCPDVDSESRRLENFFDFGSWFLNLGGIFPIGVSSEETKDWMVAPYRKRLEEIRDEKEKAQGKINAQKEQTPNPR